MIRLRLRIARTLLSTGILGLSGLFASCGGGSDDPAASAPVATRPDESTAPPALIEKTPAAEPSEAQSELELEPSADAPVAEKPAADASATDVAAPQKEGEGGGRRKREGISPRGGVARTPRAEARIALAPGEPSQHSFGKVRQGVPVAHDFQLVSDGDLPLRISLVKPTCGCQTHVAIVLLGADGSRTPYAYDQEIAPGTRFTLETKSTTEDVIGPFNSTMQVFSNAKGPPFALVLTGESEPYLIARPEPTFSFGQVTTASVVERSVTVASTHGELFRLRLVNDAVLSLAKIELVPVSPDAEGRSAEWEVRARLGPNALLGNKHWRVVLESDLPRESHGTGGAPAFHGIELGLDADVIGAFRASPTVVSFGIVRPGQPADAAAVRIESVGELRFTNEMRFEVEDQADQAFRLADLLEISLEPVEEGRVAELKVRLKGVPAGTQGSFGGLMKLHLAPPEVEPLVLRIYGSAREDAPDDGGR